jgi:hypothetical protein
MMSSVSKQRFVVLHRIATLEIILGWRAWGAFSLLFTSSFSGFQLVMHSCDGSYDWNCQRAPENSCSTRFIWVCVVVTMWQDASRHAQLCVWSPKKGSYASQTTLAHTKYLAWNAPFYSWRFVSPNFVMPTEDCTVKHVVESIKTVSSTFVR